jgi:hypothetical protein
VKAAVRVDDAVCEFATSAQALSPEDFERAYLNLVVKVQADLGSIGGAPMGT